MKTRLTRGLAATLACVAPALAAAQASPETATSVPRLDTVTVTASRVPTDSRRQPVQVSVLTAGQIEKSSATTVQELLSTQSGIHVVNATGATAQAAVDIRGFGPTGPANTLILIDGIPQNDNDVSAPSLDTVPLERIERIEIVRGSGSVQYGGGTTGGVINIITKNGYFAEQPVSASVSVTAGSYGRRQLDAAVSAHNDKIAVDVYGQTLRADNYRDNNEERRDSGGLGLTFRHDAGSIRLYARTTSDRLRLPGPRRVDPATGLDEYADDPRGTSTPDDFVSTRTNSFGAQIEQALGAGTLYADLGQRDKSLEGFTGSDFGNTERDQDLAETSGSLRYHLPVGGVHALVLGVDGRDSRLDARNTYSSSPAGDHWKARQRQHGFFAEAQIQAAEGTRLSLGARRQYADEKLETLSGYSGNSDERRHLNAWQLGVRQELGAGFGAYGKLGRSFRLANSDELLYVTAPLEPQTSLDKELGLTWESGRSSARLTWFRYDLDNEIQFNPLTFTNANLDPTRRQGVELEGHYAVTRTLTLDANLTWLQARFRSGQAAGVDLAGKTVPLVPKWMANAGATWQPTDGFFVSGEIQYVGQSRMDNDQANEFDRQLDDYVLVNGKAGYRFTPNVQATLAVNNLFDKRYATYGIRSGATGATGAYNLYPAPGRNVQATLTVRY